MPVPQRVIRARVHGRQVYLVPRADGVVVGATQYEHGRDTAPAVTGVRELLDDACAVVPALGEYELAECAAGLRPMTPDNLPIVGRFDNRVLVAAGHGRSAFCWHRGPRRRSSRNWMRLWGPGVIVTVNDERVEVDDEITVVALLRRLGFPGKGVAVALDWAVLPRSRWEQNTFRWR